MQVRIPELLPLWGFFLLTVALALLAFEIGYRVGGYFHRKNDNKTKAPLQSMVAAMMGLLAFILAFTFSFAEQRFEKKISVVLDEANAIGTTYLRSKYLVKPYSAEVPPLLIEYVTLRLEAIKGIGIPELLEKTSSTQKKLWDQVVAMVNEGHSNPVYAQYIASLNEVFDLHAKRVLLVFGIRVPNILWLMLFALTLFSIGAMGYLSGFRESRNIGVGLLVILSFSFVIYLIADLERSQEGHVMVTQQPLVDVLEMMQKDVKMYGVQK